MLDKRIQGEENGEKFNIWSSYSDMYCSLLMIFMLLFFVIVLQYLQLKDLNAEETEKAQQEFIVSREEYERQIEEQSSALSAFEEENERLSSAEAEYLRLINQFHDETTRLSEQNDGLVRGQDELNRSVQSLTTQNNVLQTQKEDLQAQNDDLKSQKAALETQNDALSAQQDALEEENDALWRQAEELDQQRVQLEQQLSTVSERLSVTEYSMKEKAELSDKIFLLLQDQLNARGIPYQMNDQKDAFVFAVEELYDEKRLQISDEGRQRLSVFFNAYMDILLKSEYTERLDLFTFVCVMPNDTDFRISMNYGTTFARDTAVVCAGGYDGAENIYDRLYISTHVDDGAGESRIEISFTLNSMES